MHLCSVDHESTSESPGAVFKLPVSWSYISRGSDSSGPGVQPKCWCFLKKSYPGDSNVYPKLRITSVGCQSREILWKVPPSFHLTDEELRLREAMTSPRSIGMDQALDFQPIMALQLSG